MAQSHTGDDSRIELPTIERDYDDGHVYHPLEGESEPLDHFADVRDEQLPAKFSDSDGILLESELSEDPSEGLQGWYTIAYANDPCPECSLPGVHMTTITLAAETIMYCPHCDDVLE